MHLRVGTRASRLAKAQTGAVIEAITRACPSCSAQMVTFTTRGDREKGPLAEVGGKGLFTAELEAGLRSGEIDLAVHSAKDMPAVLDDDLIIAAVPPRADPRDVLVSRSGSLADLAPGARIGTGSLRRAAQLKNMRNDLVIEPVRGNVDTRIEKALGDGAELDGVVLAAAGLSRAGLGLLFADSIFPLKAGRFIPAPGQGILALQAAMHRPDLIELLTPVEDRDARDALEAERAVVRSLGAGCNSSLAVYLCPERRGWIGAAMASYPDGSGLFTVHTAGESADTAAADLLEGLVENGAEDMVGD